MEKVWGCYYCDSPAHKSPACPYVKRHPEKKAEEDEPLPPTLAPELTARQQIKMAQFARMYDSKDLLFQHMRAERDRMAAQQAQFAQTLQQQVGQKGRP